MSVRKIAVAMLQLLCPADKAGQARIVTYLPAQSEMTDDELREFLEGVLFGFFYGDAFELLSSVKTYVEKDRVMLPDPLFRKTVVVISDFCLTWLPKQTDLRMLELAYWAYHRVSKDDQQKVSELVNRIATGGIPLAQREQFLDIKAVFQPDGEDVDEVVLRDMLGLSGQSYEAEVEQEFVTLLGIKDLNENEPKWNRAQALKRKLIELVDARGEDGTEHVRRLWDEYRPWESTTREI